MDISIFPPHEDSFHSGGNNNQIPPKATLKARWIRVGSEQKIYDVVKLESDIINLRNRYLRNSRIERYNVSRVLEAHIAGERAAGGKNLQRSTGFTTVFQVNNTFLGIFWFKFLLKRSP